MTWRRAQARPASLDLGFLELDVLARDRVVFAEGHLLGDVPRILLGDVIEARVGGADELDLHRGRLGHDSLFLKLDVRKRKAAQPPPSFAAHVPIGADSVKSGPAAGSRRGADVAT